jgi:hypothetical protein
VYAQASLSGSSDVLAILPCRIDHACVVVEDAGLVWPLRDWTNYCFVTRKRFKALCNFVLRVFVFLSVKHVDSFRGRKEDPFTWALVTRPFFLFLRIRAPLEGAIGYKGMVQSGMRFCV